MDKEKYMKLVDGEADEINLTDADIIEWFDKIVEAKRECVQSSYDLHFGKLDRDLGEYEKSIEICSDTVTRIHVYKGIDRLAKVLGKELTVIERHNKEDYPYEYYFKYKDAYVFQITELKVEQE